MVRGVGPKVSALGIGVTWRFMVVRSTGISKITRAPCLGYLEPYRKPSLDLKGALGGFGGLCTVGNSAIQGSGVCGRYFWVRLAISP